MYGTNIRRDVVSFSLVTRQVQTTGYKASAQRVYLMIFHLKKTLFLRREGLFHRIKMIVAYGTHYMKMSLP